MEIKTIQEVARMGGLARKNKLSPERRKEISALGVKARREKIDKRKKETPSV